MTINCINACTCKNCMKKKASLQFNIKIDPNTHPEEFEIALILRKQKGFNRMIREFLKEYGTKLTPQA